VAKINELRATENRPAYGQWTAAEACVDGQATADEQSNTPHGTFGQCDEFGQNECTGDWGVEGVESCLESMWAEKNEPNCAGCAACLDEYTQDCPGCDFYGEFGDLPCGHYVNMAAMYFDEAACGFSGVGGWVAIDFR
jgi:hypothetical protein